jgi:hypothetical protein
MGVDSVSEKFEARETDVNEGVLLSIASTLIGQLESYVEKSYLSKSVIYPIGVIFPLLSQM